MDAPAAESQLNKNDFSSWLARNRATGRVSRFATLGVITVLIVTVLFSTLVLTRSSQPGSLLAPPFIALLLVANLIPAIALMVLYSRRVARQRAKREGLGSGKLHARLVTLFSVLAAVPTVLVAIFASLLFQSGMEFWFSDRARNMLENTVAIPQAAYQAEEERVASETFTMSGDLSGYLKLVPFDDPRFVEGFGRQVLNRYLSEAIILNVSEKGEVQSLALVNPYERNLQALVTADRIRSLQNRRVVNINSSDRIGALTKLDFGPNTYLYAARVFDRARIKA